MQHVTPDIRSHSARARRLTQDELKRSRELLAANGTLQQLALDLSFNSELDCLHALGDSVGMDVVDLTKSEPAAGVLVGFPARLIHRHNVFPISRSNGLVTLAVSNPFDVQAVDTATAATGETVTAVLADSAEIAKLIKSQLGVGAETIDGLIAQTTDDDVQVLDELSFDGSEAAEAAQQASVVKLVNDILTEAVNARASDIHMESQADGLRIRYRVDGILQTQPVPPELNRFKAAIVSRLKIMSKMNIAEKRVPQDGRIKLIVSGREIDIRVSVIPMLHGEGVVMRVLDKDAMSFSLRGIGMEQDTYDAFHKLIRQPHGILLVTGPTGSGKTTTLYSALAEIRSERTKIITTEDPIEYQLEGINQIQVHAKVGLTFAASLRSILRHDPDVVLVGEIRDHETAENAIQASLTGHMVFSTLHTNDAAGAFMRLIDMGVEPFLVASTVEGVMAQRLVRTLCEDCKEAWMPSHDEVPEDFPMEECRSKPIYQPRGCRSCNGVGYSGRVGIYELLVSNDVVRQLATERKATTEIRNAAIAAGMRTLREDGWRKVMDGRTSIDEVLRVTKAD